jgi:hypothetical protein
MKKLLFIILLLPFFAKAQTTYQLNYDSIRVNKTAGTGGTSLYGKVYLKNVSAGLVSDSILSVRNGRIFKIPYSGVNLWTRTGTTLSPATANDSLNIGSGIYKGHGAKSDASDGFLIEASNGTDVGRFGVANTANSSLFGALNVSGNLTGNKTYSTNPTDGTAGTDSLVVHINSTNELARISPAYYLPTTTAASTYLPLAGGTLTGSLIGTIATFISASDILKLQRSGATNANWSFSHTDNGGIGYLNLSNLSTSKSLINFGDNGAIGFNTITPTILTNYRFISTSDVTGGGLAMQKAGVLKGMVYTANDDLYLDATSNVFFRSGLGTSNTLEVSTAGVVKIPQLTGSVTDMVTITNDGTLGRTTIPSGGGGGSVNTVGVTSANGFAGTSSGGANPALTLTTTITADVLKANGTAISGATTTGTSGTAVVLATSPTLVTPNLGTPSTLVGTNITGTASGLTAGSITGQANSATITAASTETVSTIALRDGNGDIYARSFFMNPAYGDNVPNKLVGTSAGGQIREMSQTQAKTYLDLSGTNTGDQTTITGNAGTATALQTARNIQGVSFNGTADINPINGTGFVKATGNTLSYDNTTYAPLASPALTGTPTAPTQSAADNSTKIATTAYVDNAGTYKANLNSPVFTGTPVLPTGTTGVTQSASDNSTKLATTAYVDKFNLASGTYTPTLTNTSGIASSTAGTGSYQRIGNQVSGFVDFTATGTSEGVTGVFGVSLPIASNFSAATNVWGGFGVARSGETIAPLEEVSADTTNDRFIVKATLSDLSAKTIRINFQYTIL